MILLGEGVRTFIAVYHDRIRDQADAIDHARKKDGRFPAYAGIPLSIKDLFDEAGVTTRAGSTILADARPLQALTPLFWQDQTSWFFGNWAHQHDRICLFRPWYQRPLW